jgi:hypothetical protein
MAPKLAGTGLIDCPMGGSLPWITVGPHAWCDYVTDGTADEVQIQAAIDFYHTNAKRGSILFTADTFNLSDHISIDVSNISLIGAPGGTIFSCTGDYGNIIQALSSVSDITIKDITFSAVAQRSSGSVIDAVDAQRWEITNIKIMPNTGWTDTYFYDGIYLHGLDVCVINSPFINVRHYGIACNGHADNTWGAGLVISDGKVSTFDIADSIGLHVGGGVGGLYVNSIDFIQCDIGFASTTDLAAVANREIFIVSTTFDGCRNHGIDIDGDSLGFFSLMNSWSSSNGQSNADGCGIFTGVGSSAIAPRFIISGNTIYNNKGSGILLNSGLGVLSGNYILRNGQGANGGNGISLENTFVGYSTINSNNIIENGDASVGTGLYIGTGTDYSTINGNVIALNLKVNIDDDGLAHNVIADNVS